MNAYLALLTTVSFQTLSLLCQRWPTFRRGRWCVVLPSDTYRSCIGISDARQWLNLFQFKVIHVFGFSLRNWGPPVDAKQSSAWVCIAFCCQWSLCQCWWSLCQCSLPVIFFTVGTSLKRKSCERSFSLQWELMSLLHQSTMCDFTVTFLSLHTFGVAPQELTFLRDHFPMPVAFVVISQISASGFLRNCSRISAYTSNVICSRPRVSSFPLMPLFEAFWQKTQISSFIHGKRHDWTKGGRR